MTTAELREQLDQEAQRLRRTVDELQQLREDLAGRRPTTRELTAAGTFLAQLYAGIERILKRIALFHEIPIPTGDTWHLDLFLLFTSRSERDDDLLPLLLADSLADDLAPYRRFRHVVFHGYGFELNWDRMREGVRQAPHVLDRFLQRLGTYLASLDRPS